MKPLLKYAIHVVILLFLVFQSGCFPSEGQKTRATFIPSTGGTAAPTQPAATVPATLTVSPGASNPSQTPPLETSSPPAPTLQSYSSSQKGIGFGAFLDVISPDYGMALMVAAGMNWAHIPFYWSKVEPVVDQFYWTEVSRFEDELRAAADNHLNTIIYVNDTPRWALKSGYACGAVAQYRFADMARFMTEMVKRYSAPPFNVKYFELWSEEDVYNFLGCWGDPKDTEYFGGGYYGEMLKIAYPAIKAADPQAQVLFGGLLMDCDPNHVEYCGGNPDLKRQVGGFLKGALEVGAGPYFDGISFHGYDYYGGALGTYSNVNWGAAWNTSGPVALVKAAYLRNLLAQYSLTGKYLMNTELALLCGRTGLEAPCTTVDHTRTLSAYLVQSYALGITNGLSVMIWFSVAGWRGSALLDTRKMPLSGYSAYQFASARLGNATFVKPISDFPGIKGYEFSRDGQKMWVIWSVTAAGNSQTITLKELPVAVFDMTGSPVAAGMSLNVGPEPIFIDLN
jgi:hypothetical protein